jgi:hypothetical protein
MKTTARIEEWSFGRTGDEYTAPEARAVVLVGRVYGHPRHENGSLIETSPVHKINGRTVETANTVYRLGAVEAGYAEWAKKNKVSLPVGNWKE